MRGLRGSVSALLLLGALFGESCESAVADVAMEGEVSPLSSEVWMQSEESSAVELQCDPDSSEIRAEDVQAGESSSFWELLLEELLSDLPSNTEYLLIREECRWQPIPIRSLDEPLEIISSGARTEGIDVPDSTEDEEIFSPDELLLASTTGEEFPLPEVEEVTPEATEPASEIDAPREDEVAFPNADSIAASSVDSSLFDRFADAFGTGLLQAAQIALTTLVAPPPRPPERITFQNATLRDRPGQPKIYSGAVFIFVPQGRPLQIFRENGALPPTKVAELGPIAAPPVEYGRFFNVGYRPLPPGASAPPGSSPSPERYLLGSFAWVTERRVFLVRSGSAEARLEIGPNVVAAVAPPPSLPAVRPPVTPSVKPPVSPPAGTAVGVPSYLPVTTTAIRPTGQWLNTMSRTLADIITRSPKAQHESSDPGTVAHETAHFVNNRIVNDYASGKLRDEYAHTVGRVTRYPAAGMYFGDGNGALIKGVPGHTFASVLALVPRALRTAGRVNTYFQRPDRENVSRGEIYDITYILDEANAYMLGAEAALELHDAHYLRAGTTIGATEGAGEFIAYSLALLYYIKEANGTGRSLYADGKYLTQITAAIKLNIERSARAYKLGLDKVRYPRFQVGRRDFLEKLKYDNTAEGVALRSFALRTYGESWFAEIVG